VFEMGEYNLLVNKKLRRVKLPDLRVKKVFEVEVNGKAAELELTEDVRYDKPFFIKVGGKPYRVELERRNVGASVSVQVDGVSYVAQLENRNKVASRLYTPALSTIEKKPVKTKALEKGVIAATMPGKVVLLRVKAGDRVHVGDVLLVLESMKMENEIISPISGIVKEVSVSEGAAVNIGEKMVIFSET